MAKTPKVAPKPATEGQDETIEAFIGQIDLLNTRLKVTAPAGDRRRAGIGFSPTPRIIQMIELGATFEEAQEGLRLLMDDPQLSVTPVLDEAPAEN